MKKKKIEKKNFRERGSRYYFYNKKQRISILVDIFISISKQRTKISLMTIKRRLNKQGLYKL